MRRYLLYLSILLTLPCAASAGQLSAAGSIRLDSMPAIEAIGSLADAAPVLDLSYDPPVPAAQDGPAVALPATPASVARDPEAPFSLGVKIKTRREIAGPPRRVASDPDEDPLTLTDNVEGLVERSSIGLTGTYRF